MITKIVKIKVIKPLSPVSDWGEFRKIYRQLQEETRKASNAVITQCNLFYLRSRTEDYDLRENRKEIRRNLYKTARNFSVSLQSYNSNSISNDIYKVYFTGKNSYIQRMEKGEGNPPMSYTKDIPVPIAQKKNFVFSQNQKGFWSFSFSLVSNAFKNDWNKNHEVKMKDGTFVLAVDGSNGSVRKIIENCRQGIYKMGASKLVSNEKGFFLYLTYSFEAEKKKKLDRAKVCGVDLGIQYAAVCAVNYNDYVRKSIPGDAILKHCMKLERMRKEWQRSSKYAVLEGHGRKEKVKQPQHIRLKESNYHTTVNRNIAKDIVLFAYNNGCGTIAMEDLSGFRSSHKENKMLGKWTYFQLQDFVHQKAELFGIQVIKVDPRYSSQKCSCCGFIAKENRQTQSKFQCIKCGAAMNADFNAARNISMMNQ